MLRRQALDAPPVDVGVKVMPPDVYAAADETLSVSNPSDTRRYGHGTVVTLLAPKLTGYDFKYWLIDGTEVYPPPGAPPLQISVTMSGPHEAIPVYVGQEL